MAFSPHLGQGNLYRQIKSESWRLKLDMIIQDALSSDVYCEFKYDHFRGIKYDWKN